MGRTLEWEGKKKTLTKLRVIALIKEQVVTNTLERKRATTGHHSIGHSSLRRVRPALTCTTMSQEYLERPQVMRVARMASVANTLQSLQLGRFTSCEEQNIKAVNSLATSNKLNKDLGS